MNWDAISAGIKSVESAISGFTGWLEGKTKGVSEWMQHHLPGEHSMGPLGVPGFEGVTPPGGGETTPKKQSWNVVPPANSGTHTQIAAVYLDGRKVGEAVVSQISDYSHSGIEGSPYHDPTQPSSTPLDFALV